MARKKTISNHEIKYSTGLYVRLSREDGDDKYESNSITNQRTMLQDYVDDYPEEFAVYNIYSDDNYSGTNFNRPAFQSMLSDIEKGFINCVIVKDLSRFGRDYIDTGYYLEKYFIDKGVRFIALSDNVDSLKQSYDMLLPVKNVFNQQYAVDISKKVQSSFKTKQRKGDFIGAFPSYGYQKDPKDHNKLILDEYAAQIVRRIFKMYLDGMGQIKIAHVLNAEKILCPSEYKKQIGLNYKNSNRIETTKYWTYSTVHKILSNQMYKGDMVQNKTVRRMKGKAKYRPEDEWIIVENTHQAIIDYDTWNRTQNLLNRNTRQLNFVENVSIFAGFLKCADCGRAMAKNKRANTTYYVCGSYKRYGIDVCTSHTITHDKLEDIVIDYINASIKTIKNLSEIAKSNQKFQEKNTNSKKEIQKTQISLEKIYNLKKGLYEDYKEGILTKEEYLRLKNDYEVSEKFYKDKIETLEKQSDETENNIFENPWLVKLLENKKFDKLDRTILADFIDCIEINDNKKIIINWNCPNEVNELLQII